jgi:CBS domain-containing protein
MIEVPVSSVMVDGGSTVSPDLSTVEAAKLLRQRDVAALVVCDNTDTVVGIVTASDIVALVAERGGNRAIESFMSAPVVSVPPSTPIGLAADRMCDAGITHLPVVSDDDSYEGLVTPSTLAPYLSRHRLEIDWGGDPLSLDETDSADIALTAEPPTDDAAE